MTGNTEEIADIVADKFRDLGVEVDVDECTTVDAEDFLDADIRSGSDLYIQRWRASR